MFVWDSVARPGATSWKSTKVENAAEMLPPTVPRPWNHGQSRTVAPYRNPRGRCQSGLKPADADRLPAAITAPSRQTPCAQPLISLQCEAVLRACHMM